MLLYRAEELVMGLVDDAKEAIHGSEVRRARQEDEGVHENRDPKEEERG
jgi:hypothetical protein